MISQKPDANPCAPENQRNGHIQMAFAVQNNKFDAHSQKLFPAVLRTGFRDLKPLGGQEVAFGGVDMQHPRPGVQPRHVAARVEQTPSCS